VHKWRSEEAAILVGKNTVLTDDPSLTNRLWKGNDPVRIVIDKQLQIPIDSKIFGQKPKTIIFNCVKDEAERNSIFVKVNEHNVIEEILAFLYIQGLQSIIVEGGRQTLQSFIDVDLWDEARVITNTILVIANGTSAPDFKRQVLLSKEKINNDTIEYYKNDI
jgi:diaminohydroxyphosphoribosylaminopyrimidine deaminase/5-amino-6-(5-phosphoribosylamino)uracil reductase